MKKAMIILLSVMMFTSMLIIPGNTGDVEAGAPEIESLLTPHAPVRINNNTDFATLGLNGSGTPVDPWIIENWDINGTGVGYCLYIGNTTENFVVRNCSFHDAMVNQDAMTLWKADNGRIVNTTFTLNDFNGFMATECTNITIENSTASYNWNYGLRFTLSDNCNISNSNIFSNDFPSYGLFIDDSLNFNITSNTFMYDGIQISSPIINEWTSHHIDTSNTVDGKPIYFMKDQIGGSVPTGAGQVIMANCTGMTVENQVISNGADGLTLAFSDNNTITNNSFVNNMRGVHLTYDSYNNTIFLNNFFDNTINALDLVCTNFWNESYPIGGNYWSDYNGEDLLSGPGQDMLGSDGFGDTNYSSLHWPINYSAVDHYPLFYPTNHTDAINPNSTVDAIIPYWLNSPYDITANASDNETWISNITLHYRFSTDNTTFGSWIEFGMDEAYSWNWTFDFPEGEGYYEFYSIAIDAFNNTELAPATADAFLAYDTTLPESEIFQPDTFWLNNRTIYLDWNASDSLSGFGDLTTGTFPSHENVDMWTRYSADNTTWTPWTLAVENMWNGSVFNHTVLLDGYYQFYSIAQDLANNTELAPTEYDVFVGFDAVLPIAKAGDNQTISQYDQVIFDAADSTDSMGIVNYTWTFNYASQDLVVNMEKFNFTFNHYGHYEITLEVRDGAGNSATDTLWVTVLDTEDPIADAGEDQESDIDIWITFDGSGSTDNVAVFTYTWTFVYNGSIVTLDGMYPKFKFAEHDTYDVTLTITDEAGNSDTDTMQVYVAEDITQSGSSFAWIVVVFVLVLMVAALGIMMFYFKKGTQTQMDDRDRREARSHREDQYEDEYEDDDRY
ncbi:MAG: right-handed parallel beta-helix repeat-containing protein [Thermoplasmata archaeon]|nr:right-handed parallel beta-helix repeat-containing protein [Thermoplasmata archaeon]